jgi:hypothetical protein
MTLTGISASTNGLSFSANTWTDFYTNGTGANVALVNLNTECVLAAGCAVAVMVTDASDNNVTPVLPLTALAQYGEVNLNTLVIIPNGYKVRIFCSVASASSPIVCGASLIGGMF